MGSRLPFAADPVYTQLSHPFAAWPATELLQLVFSPLAKWDSLHYLTIAYDGYAEGVPGLPPAEKRAAFFPLYPGTVRVLSGFGASRGLVLLVAYAVSLACFFGALTLLHRLTVLEIGERYARPALLLLAFFPAAFYYGIPYTESMFLLLAVGAFLAARTGRWALAGIALALASATRFPGLLLVVPVGVIYLYGPRTDAEPEFRDGLWPRFRIRPDFAWLALAPLGLIAFAAYLHFATGDATAWAEAQSVFGRETVNPITGAWEGVNQAWLGVQSFQAGTYNGVSALNVFQLALVAFAIYAGISMLRTLPVAYGIWVLVSLAPLFVSQAPGNPFWSAARFIAVLFPIFLWLAVICERRGITATVLAVFAAGLALFTAQFSLWSFFA